MSSYFNLKLKISLLILLTIFISTCVVSFFGANFLLSVTAQPINNQPSLINAGSYEITVISISGAQVNPDSGGVQINGGTVSGEESVIVEYQTPLTLQAYPSEGYEFSGWYSAVIGGQLISRSATLSFNAPSEDRTYYALFSVNTFSVSVASSPTGAGYLTGGGTHDYNELANINASASNNNYLFYRWVENGAEISSSPDISFNVKRDYNLIAEFKVSVTADINGQGQVLIDENTEFTQGYFLHTKNIVLTAVPAEGYEFAGWSEGSTSSSPTINVKVGVTAKNYVANFSLIGAHLFVNATDGGSVEGSSISTTYARGEEINLVATALQDYNFAYWEGEFSGSLNTSLNQTNYIVTLDDVLRGNITFTAVFELKPIELTAYSSVNGQLTQIGGQVSINSSVVEGAITQLVVPEKQVTVNAHKADGYAFVGWYDQVSSGNLLSENDNYSFIMPQTEYSVYARFQISYWYEHRSSPLGDGTSENPYIIENENQLAWLAYTTNTGLSFSKDVFVELVNDLDLSAYMWEPIGNANSLNISTEWQGNFNGNGYVINGVNIDKEPTRISYYGLFGSLSGAGAKVSNLGLKNLNIQVLASQNNYTGSVAGQIKSGVIENCYILNSNINVTNTTSGYNYVGGIVGNNTNAKILNNYVFSNIYSVNTLENASYVGGVAGNNYGADAFIKNNYAVINIDLGLENLGATSNYVGALVGFNSVNASLQNCYYSIEHSSLNIIGANNANQEYNKGKTLEELKNFNTYVNETSSWDFANIWLLPKENYNNGLPILRGVGNLIVNSQAGPNGIIEPSGQTIYLEKNGLLEYIITPDKNYQIKLFTVNGEEQNAYTGSKNSSVYNIKADVGVKNLQATFEERVREPISPFILIAIFIGPVIFLISKLIKFINKKLSRRRRLKYAVKKYKKMKRKDKKKTNKKNKA